MKMSAVATPPMLCASGRGAVGVVPGAVVASGLSGRRPAAAPLSCLLLLLLVFCLSALPARAHVVDELAPLLDSDAIVNSIQDIGLLKKAGFIYQPDLTITGEMCPVDGSQDQLAVLSGMLAADRMYAFYFGDVADAAKKNELLQQLVGKPLPALNSKDMARIRKAPHSQESANILARFRQQELSRLLEVARQDDQLLRLLGAHLYGLYLERLYMASVMVLAAAESDTLEPLYQVHTRMRRHTVTKNLLRDLLADPDADAGTDY